MPRSTVQYPFEFQVLEWAASFSVGLTGEHRGFLLVVDEVGEVRQFWSGEGKGHFDLALKEELVAENERWLFYDPFDAPEYTFIEWQGLESALLERLIGKAFEARALVSARDGKSIEHIPASWRVMF